ncbi:hypothetical protein [Enterobacter cloacae complex sp. 402G1]|uniref:hypothetical protein n=1 Tax=Enterobacter cloacae complex sp. 402G1 TaxID=3395864 RepID=UPI003CFA2FDB
MNTLTKEWLLKTITELEEERDAVPGVVNEDAAMALAAMKLAMASLEAEPVCVIDQSNLDYLNSGSDADVWPASRKEMGDVLLYRTAPPAPVSVPDAYVRDERGRMMLNGRQEPRIGYGAGWNGYRDAMLQGADPVTTANKLPFEKWLSQQTGTIDVECGCVMTEVFFHWLRVAYEAGNSPVIPDGWVMVPEEPTHEMLEAGDEQFGTYDVYRRMIAASPQQEVK